MGQWWVVGSDYVGWRYSSEGYLYGWVVEEGE
jgi:hypothetical protein